MNEAAWLLDEELLETELAERRLGEFLRAAWPIVEPERPLVPNWHLDAICEHLEAVSRGEIRNLLINVPPGTMKSLTAAVAWPAWAWLRQPSRRWLFTSYADRLSVRDSVRCRRLIVSPWYQARWGDRFRLTDDQNQKIKFENDRTGFRLATSVGGANTGERGDIIVADDPHNVVDGESDAIRESTLLWWDEAMSTRLNDQRSGAKVIIMQRVHEGDLAGHALEKGTYEHLTLPMESEGRRCVVEKWHRCSQLAGTSIGYVDQRAEGDLLFPELFPETVVRALESELGEYAAAAQLQQRPAPRKGGMFAVERFAVVPGPPAAVVDEVRAWDKAATRGGTGARSAGVRMARLADGRWIVRGFHAGRWSAPDRETEIRQTAGIDGSGVRIWVEQEPGSGGKESAEATVRNLAGFRVVAEPVRGDKVLRAEPYASQVNAGSVLLERGDWNREFIEEHRKFPVGRLKDIVDAAGAAFAQLAKPSSAGLTWGQ